MLEAPIKIQDYLTEKQLQELPKRIEYLVKCFTIGTFDTDSAKTIIFTQFNAIFTNLNGAGKKIPTDPTHSKTLSQEHISFIKLHDKLSKLSLDEGTLDENEISNLLYIVYQHWLLTSDATVKKNK